MPKEEAENISFIDFGLTGPGLKPTIYRNRGEHANNYTTDAVIKVIFWLYINFFTNVQDWIFHLWHILANNNVKY